MLLNPFPCVLERFEQSTVLYHFFSEYERSLDISEQVDIVSESEVLSDKSTLDCIMSTGEGLNTSGRLSSLLEGG